MFSGVHMPVQPSDAELATQTLNEESSYRFTTFTANDAVTLGLSLRKRFRASSRHAKGKGMVISIQTIAGHPLFSCTVGDLGGISGIGDVSLDSWSCLEGMINVVKRTGHSSYYVEKGMLATGKTPSELGIQGEVRVLGGAFPIWLENAPCCPIAVAGCYSGSSVDDHHLVVSTIKDYLKKMMRESAPPSAVGPGPGPIQMPTPVTERDPHRPMDNESLRGGESVRGGSLRGGESVRAESVHGGESVRGGGSFRGEQSVRGGESMRGGESIRRGESPRGGGSLREGSLRGGGSMRSRSADGESVQWIREPSALGASFHHHPGFHDYHDEHDDHEHGH